MKQFKLISPIIFLVAFLSLCPVILHAQNSSESPQVSNSNQETSANTDFQKLLEESKNTSPNQNSSLSDDVKVEIINPNNEKKGVEEKKIPEFPKTMSEIIFASSVGGVFLLLNFLASIFLPRYRYLFIGVPFDIGVKESKTESQMAVKSKRNWIEITLLTVVIGIFYFFTVSEKSYPEENIIQSIISGCFTTVIAYFIYIVARLIWGLKSKCPSCKNMFAVKCTNSYNEPRNSYEEKGSPSSYFGPNGERGHRRTVKVMESGVSHSDYLCSVCNHTWHNAKNYTRNISSYTENC
jgi:hypothetical protein